MSFTEKDWRNRSDTSTPLSASALEDLESRLSAYTDASVAASPGRVDPADVGYDVVLLAGQSNMSGRGAAYDLTRYDPVDPRIFQWGNSGEFADLISQAVEPLAMHDIPSGMGPGLVFARWYAKTLPANRSVLLVPAAHGGTGFEGTDLSWDVAASEDVSLYENAITQVEEALAAAGENARLVAVLWHQGEADATSGDPDNYADHLDDLIDGLRTRFDDPDLPFIVGQMVPEGIAANATRQTVDAAHVATPGRKARTAFVYGPNDMQNGDDLHYNAPGQRILGFGYFEALARAQANVLGSTPPAVTGLVAEQVAGGTIFVSWDQPVGRVTAYSLQYRELGIGAWTTVSHPTLGTSDEITVTDGPTYEVRIAAVNEQGSGAYTTVTADTVAVPAQVTGLAAGIPGTVTVPLTWDAVPDAATYLMEYRLAGATPWSDGGTTLTPSGTVSGLSPASDYEFRVTASNVAGDGTPSATLEETTATLDKLLTDVSAAAARAYGLRKLSSSYAGSAIKVRRSSDNATMDVGFTAGGDLDTAAMLAWSGSDSVFVDTLYDQSGNARDMTQATTSAQPRIVNAGVLETKNSKPTMNFLGAQYFTDSSPGMYAAGAATVLVVVSGGAQSNTRLISESNSTTNTPQYTPLFARSDGRPGVFAVNDAGADVIPSQALGPTTFDSTLHVSSTRDTGNKIEQWVDGGATGGLLTYTRTGTLTLNRFSIGALVRTTVGSFFTGQISEVVTWREALTDADHQAGEANEKAYYGVA